LTVALVVPFCVDAEHAPEHTVATSLTSNADEVAGVMPLPA